MIGSLSFFCWRVIFMSDRLGMGIELPGDGARPTRSWVVFGFLLLL